MNPVISLGVADDEPDILRLFQIMLERSGFPVSFLARDGEEAIALQRKSPADIVFLDYYMPLMDGLNASKAILREFPNTRIILMTAGEDIEDLVKSIGDITVLKKPFAFKAVVDMLAGIAPLKNV